MTPLRFLSAFLLGFTLPVSAQPGGFGSLLGGPGASEAKEVAASLEAGQTAFVPGQPLDVALKLVHPEHWHTYWLNPGIGTPTELKWELPEGWQSTPLIWPVPQVKPSELGNQHIYEGTTYLFTTLTPPAALKPGSSITLKAKSKWLVCDEGSMCNPGGSALTLTLPVAAAAEPVPAIQAELAKVKAVQAQTHPAWQVKLDPKWTVTLTPAEGANPDPGGIYFFDHTKAVTTEPPVITREGNIIRLALKPSDEDSKDAPAGFVHASKGWLKDGSVPSLEVGANSPPKPGPALPSPAAPSETKHPVSPGTGTVSGASGQLFSGQPGISFWVALGSLFLAGMILNLMPCVFPVLALKVLSFAKQAGKDPAETRKHGLAYTMGLLVFVWLVAGGMFVAKTAFGFEFAWGDITRYSGAIAAVVIVLFLLGLNLAGLFEIGTSLSSVGGELQEQKGYAGSFWSGALTMLISTPCSGPFMALAMGYALQQPALQQFVLFTSFGLGIALPYVVLSCSPVLLKKLPRPGAWMETFRKALAFPMFGAAIYFYNSFMTKTGGEGASLLLWALLLTAISAWIYGHWCVPSRSSRSRLSGGFIALLIAAAGTWMAVGASGEKLAASSSASTVYMTGKLGWTAWSPETLAAERAKGRPVFVNYTTVNCPTCDSNELLVFKRPFGGSDEVVDKFQSLKVATLRAKYLNDDTPNDNLIRESLRAWGISTFPVYVVYPADASKSPFLVSSGVLTQSQVIEALEKSVL